jgi:hypothetical protein
MNEINTQLLDFLKKIDYNITNINNYPNMYLAVK